MMMKKSGNLLVYLRLLMMLGPGETTESKQCGAMMEDADWLALEISNSVHDMS